MKHLFLWAGLVVSMLVSGQNKQLTLEDAVLGRSSWLRPAGFEKLTWRNGNAFTFVENDTLCEQFVNESRKHHLLPLTVINSHLNTLKKSSLHGFPVYEWLSSDRILFTSGRNFLEYSFQAKQFSNLIELPENAENVIYCNENQKVAFTIENNLFVLDKNGKQVQITNDIDKGIVNGKSVHRNEFGINNGIFWSPNGKKLAFYRMDETMVTDYPLVDYMVRVAEVKPIKYPMAGMLSHHVTIGIFDIETGQTTFLKTGEPLDKYLTNLAWSPNEEDIFIIELNREQNHSQLNKYNVSSGLKSAGIIDEKNNKYVEPLHPVQFSKSFPGTFYLLSRVNGWFHVYHHQADGKLIRQITKGNWEVTDILGFDTKEKFMFFEATRESPVERHLYKVEIKTGKIENLSVQPGVHNGILSPGGEYLIDHWSSSEVPNVVDMITVKNGKVSNLLIAADPLSDYELAANRIFTIKAADDSTDLWCRVIEPANPEPGKKYPAIVYVYGGPHAQLVNKSWTNGAAWWEYYMASKGFVVFVVDGRGTANRGSKFENIIHRQLGKIEVADQMKGIEYLKSLPFVDSERIGVHGWSYGGFMTISMMLQHPDVFRAGVAGGPVIDWNMYEIMYGERYMDTPQENPEGYMRSSLLNQVAGLNGRLMLVHGVQDDTVVLQHSMKFLAECIKQGKQVDFFVYPTHPHNVRGKDRVHLMEKVSEFFIRNL